MKIVDNIFSWIGMNLGVANPSTFQYQVIKDVLIVHVPIGRLPPHRAEELLKKHMEQFSSLKEDFGVKKVYCVGKRDY